MAQIKQIGPGCKTTGTIDGVTYVTRNGKTYVRSVPTMPASAYNTPAAKKRLAIFKFIQMHLKYHLRTKCSRWGQYRGDYYKRERER